MIRPPALAIRAVWAAAYNAIEGGHPVPFPRRKHTPAVAPLPHRYERQVED